MHTHTVFLYSHNKLNHLNLFYMDKSHHAPPNGWLKPKFSPYPSAKTTPKTSTARALVTLHASQGQIQSSSEELWISDAFGDVFCHLFELLGEPRKGQAILSLEHGATLRCCPSNMLKNYENSFCLHHLENGEQSGKLQWLGGRVFKNEWFGLPKTVRVYRNPIKSQLFGWLSP